jgi:hypothetical protein
VILRFVVLLRLLQKSPSVIIAKAGPWSPALQDWVLWFSGPRLSLRIQQPEDRSQNKTDMLPILPPASYSHASL